MWVIIGDDDHIGLTSPNKKRKNQIALELRLTQNGYKVVSLRLGNRLIESISQEEFMNELDSNRDFASIQI